MEHQQSKELNIKRSKEFATTCCSILARRLDDNPRDLTGDWQKAIQYINSINDTMYFSYDDKTDRRIIAQVFKKQFGRDINHVDAYREIKNLILPLDTTWKAYKRIYRRFLRDMLSDDTLDMNMRLIIEELVWYWGKRY